MFLRIYQLVGVLFCASEIGLLVCASENDKMKLYGDENPLLNSVAMILRTFQLLGVLVCASKN